MSEKIVKDPLGAKAPLPLGKGETAMVDIADGFGVMIGELKEKAADKWSFWDNALADLSGSTESYSLSKTEPVVLMPMGKNKDSGQKLILKCDNAAVRAEMYMIQGSLIEAVNRHLPENKQVVRIIFR